MITKLNVFGENNLIYPAAADLIPVAVSHGGGAHLPLRQNSPVSVFCFLSEQDFTEREKKKGPVEGGKAHLHIIGWTQ